MKRIFKLFIVDEEEKTPLIKKIFNMALVLLILYAILKVSFGGYILVWSSLTPYIDKLFDGYKMTLIITFFCDDYFSSFRIYSCVFIKE